MEKFIIVEHGQFADGNGTPSYQFYERATNGTYRLAENIPDGEKNHPMYLRDARRRIVEMNRARTAAAEAAREIEE